MAIAKTPKPNTASFFKEKDDDRSADYLSIPAIVKDVSPGASDTEFDDDSVESEARLESAFDDMSLSTTLKVRRSTDDVGIYHFIFVRNHP